MRNQSLTSAIQRMRYTPRWSWTLGREAVMKMATERIKKVSSLKYPIVTILLSAFVGALFGYLFAMLQQAQELRAKQQVLLTLLQDGLALISVQVDPYRLEKAFYRDPIRLGALSSLLDGEALDYGKNGDLIRKLVLLRTGISKYNDFVQVTNLAQATSVVPDSTHTQWYETMRQRHEAVIQARTEVLTQLKASGMLGPMVEMR